MAAMPMAAIPTCVLFAYIWWPDSPAIAFERWKASEGGVGAGDELNEGRWCDASGGVLLSLSLKVRQKHGPSPSSPTQDGRHNFVHDDTLTACVPLECASWVRASCGPMRRQILEELLLSSETWFFDGRNKGDGRQHDSSAVQVDTAAYKALRVKEPYMPSLSLIPRANDYRIPVVSIHGPLSLLLAEHLMEAFSSFAPAMSSGTLALPFYGQCYLCKEFENCWSRHHASLADKGCNWHQEALAVDSITLADEVALTAAEFVAAEGSKLDAVVCHGLLLCHALFGALPASVSRLQVLCMNPLQDVPAALIGPVLHGLSERVALMNITGRNNDGLYATNAITSLLLAFHMGRASTPEEVAMAKEHPFAPALVLFSRRIHNMALHSTWSADSRNLLFARAMLLMREPTLNAFESVLQQKWSEELAGGEVKSQGHRWNFFTSDSGIDTLLQHRAVVYIPEHPYKNLFNDYYAAGIPVAVPSRFFLARFWPQVPHFENTTTYDGWFDRRIPRLRLAGVDGVDHSHDVVPEPFDLDIDGESKVLHWLRLADYYHFPGVFVFEGVAHCLEQLLNTQAAETSKHAMTRYFERERAVALSVFVAFVARVSRPSLNGAEPAHPASRLQPPRRLVAIHADVAKNQSSEQILIPGSDGVIGDEFHGTSMHVTADAIMSIAVELPWEAGPIALFFLEYVNAMLAGRVSPASWTFLICETPEAGGDSQDTTYDSSLGDTWRKVVTLFGVSVGFSIGCMPREQSGVQHVTPRRGSTANDVGTPLEAFLWEIGVTQPQLVLMHDSAEASAAAPAWLAVAHAAGAVHSLQIRAKSLYGDKCAFAMGPALGSERAQGTACIMKIGGPESLVPSHDLHRLIVEEWWPEGLGQRRDDEHGDNDWVILVLSYEGWRHRSRSDELGDFMNLMLTQAVAAVEALPGRQRSITEVLRLYAVPPVLSLGSHPPLRSNGMKKISIEELHWVRKAQCVKLCQQMEGNDPKLELTLPMLLTTLTTANVSAWRKHLMQVGLSHILAQVVWTPEQEGSIEKAVQGRLGYHMQLAYCSDSGVAVSGMAVHEGRYVFDVWNPVGDMIGAAGEIANITFVKEHMMHIGMHVRGFRQGMVVEELTLAREKGSLVALHVEEVRCHIAWGQVVVVEWSIHRQETVTFSIQTDRVGRRSFGMERILEAAQLFEYPELWIDSVLQSCLPHKVEPAATGLAAHLQLDYVAVDFWISGACEAVIVAGVDVVPKPPRSLTAVHALERAVWHGYGA